MNAQMRLCFVVPEYASRPPLGGIATYTRDTARWLVEHGHTVHVVCITRRGPHGDEEDAGVSVHFVPPTRIRPRTALRLAGHVPGLGRLREAYAGWDLLENSLGAWRVVWALERKVRFDLFECADFGGLAFWGLLSPLRDRIVLRGHGYLNLELEHVNWPGRRFHQALERFCAQKARWIVTNSHFLAASYRQSFGVAQERLVIVPPGFVRPAPLTGAGALRSELGWVSNPIVLYAGRLEAQKGVDLLFEALVKAKAVVPELRAVLLGAVNERFRPAYKAFMDEADRWVWHPGAVSPPRVAEIMQQVDIVVLPSRTETFGRVLVEAQLCGCAVIGMRLGGMPEIVEHERTGLLVEPEDPGGLAAAIVRLCRAPELRMKLASAGRLQAEQRFNINSTMTKQLDLYSAFITSSFAAAKSDGASRR